MYTRSGTNYDYIDEPPVANNDDTTEWTAMKLYHNHGKKSIDVFNIYVPPIRTGRSDARNQNFDAESLPNSPNTLILGDINGHHPLWDDNCTESDHIGENIAE